MIEKFSSKINKMDENLDLAFHTDTDMTSPWDYQTEKIWNYKECIKKS